VSDEERVSVLIRQMHERAENAPWALRAEDIRSQRRPRVVGISNPKVLGLVAAAIVISLLAVVLGTGVGSGGHDAHRVATPPPTTTTAPLTTTTTNGIARVTVPEVVGESQAVAQSTLKEVGLTVGQIHLAPATIAAGTVISQEPIAGSLVVPGSVVTITVSSGT
jgi:beta-lactam-binding protein with PASTA domain